MISLQTTLLSEGGSYTYMAPQRRKLMTRTKLMKSITTPLIITNVILLFMQIFTNILSKDIETAVMMNLVFTCLNALFFLLLMLAIIGDKLSLMAHKGRIITLFVCALAYSGFGYLYGSRPKCLRLAYIRICRR